MDQPESPKPARTYSSAKMATRRERIVRIAHGILAEGGPDALTINRLSEEAGVAPSTIYRGFDSKEGVILATIVEHMRGIREFLSRTPSRGDIDSIFSEYDWIVAELYRDPEYGRVVIDFYFSGQADRAARDALRSVAEMRISAYITTAAEAGHILPGLDLERLIAFQVDTEYGVFHRWARGLIDRSLLADELKATFLMTAAAAVDERWRGDIVDRLTALHGLIRDASTR